MKAARFYAAGDVRVEEVAARRASPRGELLVRIRECGICGTDLHEYRHGPIQTSEQPHPRTGAGAAADPRSRVLRRRGGGRARRAERRRRGSRRHHAARCFCGDCEARRDRPPSALRGA